jgi:hypothetical protein
MGFHPCYQFIVTGKHVFGSQQQHISCTAQPLLALKSCQGIFKTTNSQYCHLYYLSGNTKAIFMFFWQMRQDVFISDCNSRVWAHKMLFSLNLLF